MRTPLLLFCVLGTVVLSVVLPAEVRGQQAPGGSPAGAGGGASAGVGPAGAAASSAGGGSSTSSAGVGPEAAAGAGAGRAAGTPSMMAESSAAVVADVREIMLSVQELEARRFVVRLPTGALSSETEAEVPLTLENGQSCQGRTQTTGPQGPVELVVAGDVGGCELLFTGLEQRGKVKVELPRWLGMPAMMVQVEPEPSLKMAEDTRWSGWCEGGSARQERDFVYCVDLIQESVFTPRGQAAQMGPQQTLVVVLRYDEGPVRVNVKGATGIYRPEIQGLEVLDGFIRGGSVANNRTQVALYSFPGLLPGAVSLEVTQGEEVRAFSFQVQRQYVGALKASVAFPTLDAVDRRYDVYRPVGSDQGQLVEVDSGVVDVELVMGYKHFFQPALEGEVKNRLGVYFGVGVLKGSDGGVNFLQSYYLGLDYGNAYFSVALAGVLRQTDRLAEGLEVGDPVTSSADIRLNSAFRFGVAVVVSPAPELLQWKR
ncbi:MAG: hypothetical protein ACKO6N_09240 [Myxococcota bacterium]